MARIPMIRMNKDTMAAIPTMTTMTASETLQQTQNESVTDVFEY
jgi:hypothetical protein